MKYFNVATLVEGEGGGAVEQGELPRPLGRHQEVEDLVPHLTPLRLSLYDHHDVLHDQVVSQGSQLGQPNLTIHPYA